MIVREIQEFSQARYQARAYLCYLLTRNMPSGLPSPNLQNIIKGLNKIAHEVDNIDALYVLDPNGIQITNNVSSNIKFQTGKDEDRSGKSYFYRAIKEGRCVLSDPYPSSLTNSLCVTAGFPVYNDKDEICYVVCIDVSLVNILKIAQPSRAVKVFTLLSRTIYTCFSIALFLIASVMFFHGIENFSHNGFNLTTINIEKMFQATILLTLALAIFDLVKTIFEEEVLGRNKNNQNNEIHKTMVRFLGSIIIALAIEALMLVFKFAMMKPENIIYAVYLIIGVTSLLVGLSIYLKTVNSSKEKKC